MDKVEDGPEQVSGLRTEQQNRGTTASNLQDQKMNGENSTLCDPKFVD